MPMRSDLFKDREHRLDNARARLLFVVSAPAGRTIRFCSRRRMRMASVVSNGRDSIEPVDAAQRLNRLSDKAIEEDAEAVIPRTP